MNNMERGNSLYTPLAGIHSYVASVSLEGGWSQLVATYEIPQYAVTYVSICSEIP